MSFTYEAEQWLPYPLEVVFAFFANPENLPRLMPPWQKARIDHASIVSPPPHPNGHRTPAAGTGTRLTLSFRPVPLSPIRLTWDAEITEFVWNEHFCDTQLERGPFASWKHCHAIHSQSRPDPSGSSIPGTRVHDVVHYTPPLGRFGALARPLISLQLNYMFNYRHKQTAKLMA